MSTNLPRRLTAVARWRPAHGEDPAITITDPAGEPVGIVPLADTGSQPSMAELDDLLGVLGYTRSESWRPAAHGLIASVSPIRPVHPEGGTR